MRKNSNPQGDSAKEQLTRELRNKREGAQVLGKTISGSDQETRTEVRAHTRTPMLFQEAMMRMIVTINRIHLPAVKVALTQTTTTRIYGRDIKSQLLEFSALQLGRPMTIMRTMKTKKMTRGGAMKWKK